MENVTIQSHFQHRGFCTGFDFSRKYGTVSFLQLTYAGADSPAQTNQCVSPYDIGGARPVKCDSFSAA
jgi:hypothetical protein